MGPSEEPMDRYSGCHVSLSSHFRSIFLRGDSVHMIRPAFQAFYQDTPKARTQNKSQAKAQLPSDKDRTKAAKKQLQVPGWLRVKLES